MRHKYPTECIVLGRLPLAEESMLVTMLTRDVGLVRVRAQGVRKSGAKLAGALVTFAHSDVILVAGKDVWRVSGALLREQWFPKLSPDARTRAARVSSLLLRLVRGESPDAEMFDSFMAFLAALAMLPGELHDAAECLAALRLLAALGLDAGELPGGIESPFTPETLGEVLAQRSDFINRINRGITASGL